VKSFEPISLAAVAPLMVTVNPNFPARDMKELIAYAKANPGKVSFGSSGIGSATHLTMELLKQTAGIDMVHIPFKGTAPGIAAAEAGDIQVEGDVPSSLMPHVRAGKLRAICVYGSKRSAGAPEVPTIVESGGPAIEGSTWIMFLAPAGTPQSIVNRISEETARIVNDPAMKDRFEKLGIDAVGTTPAETAKYLQDEIVKWGKVIEVAGVKPDA
jgi:tripartite-type tricarboxylate transporter receptor subunit TctC